MEWRADDMMVLQVRYGCAWYGPGPLVPAGMAYGLFIGLDMLQSVESQSLHAFLLMAATVLPGKRVAISARGSR